MTLWYLIGTVVVLGIAILSVVSAGSLTSTPVLWGSRILPAVAALLACVAFCIASKRARLGILAPVYFCLPLLALSALLILPYIPAAVAARKSNVYVMLLTIYPLLTLFPAMALYHLASALKRGRAR